MIRHMIELGGHSVKCMRSLNRCLVFEQVVTGSSYEEVAALLGDSSEVVERSFYSMFWVLEWLYGSSDFALGDRCVVSVVRGDPVVWLDRLDRYARYQHRTLCPS